MRTRMSWDYVGEYPIFVYTTFVDHKVFRVKLVKGARGNQNAPGYGPEAPAWREYVSVGVSSKAEVVKKALKRARKGLYEETRMFKLKPEWKYVAEDANGLQCFYVALPTRLEHVWESGDSLMYDTELFEPLPLGDNWKDSLHKIVDGKLIPFKQTPKLAVDTPIWVRGRALKWVRRHFSHFNGDGEGEGVNCFLEGRTSFTSDADEGVTHCWAEYSLTDPETKA